MSEKDNLQHADGTEETKSKQTKVEHLVEEENTENTTEVNPNLKVEEKEESLQQKDDDDGVNEIDESNAEDAEDEDNQQRHIIEFKDYHSMNMDELIDELTNLIHREKIQAIRRHVDSIKKEFNEKHSHFLDEKKDEFVNDGGNPVDFYYSSPYKKRFNIAYKEYKNKLRTYFKNIEQNLKENLQNRLEIIEELKGLINIEENINTTYKHFKEIQERWRNAGPIPREKYNDTWNTYHHHVEIFYDFLHLNRDLRDLDFKHNLEEKQKIIARAQELASEEDVNKAFRELQVLHKMWKEELGPVAKEHREEIWTQFKKATKAIHDKRQEYFEKLDEIYQENLVKKEDIISKIIAIAENEAKTHKGWQEKIKKVESLREAFFKAGKVPLKVNEATWSKFKESVRAFNRKKNAFYKGLKKEQQKNLDKKLDLIKIAVDNKDNEDFESTTPLMKKIQAEWKTIGHVPRKESDKIWKQFKDACNHYFDRLHAERNQADKQEMEAFEKKQAFLEDIKSLEFSGAKDENIEKIKSKIEEWKTIGRVPYNKRYIETNFNKVLDGLFKQLDFNKKEAELIKYENKLDALNNDENSKKLDNELFFIKKKVDDLKHEINQLENNLLFFAHVEDDNPVVKEVHNNINKHKEELKIWKAKLRKIKDFY